MAMACGSTMGSKAVLQMLQRARQHCATGAPPVATTLSNHRGGVRQQNARYATQVAVVGPGAFCACVFCSPVSSQLRPCLQFMCLGVCVCVCVCACVRVCLWVCLSAGVCVRVWVCGCVRLRVRVRVRVPDHVPVHVLQHSSLPAAPARRMSTSMPYTDTDTDTTSFPIRKPDRLFGTGASRGHSCNQYRFAFFLNGAKFWIWVIIFCSHPLATDRWPVAGRARGPNQNTSRRQNKKRDPSFHVIYDSGFGVSQVD